MLRSFHLCELKTGGPAIGAKPSNQSQVTNRFPFSGVRRHISTRLVRQSNSRVTISALPWRCEVYQFPVSMAYSLPLPESVVFHVLTSISFIAASVTCYVYVARAREQGVPIFSPTKNPFFNHMILLSSCSIFHILRPILLHGLISLEGSRVGRVMAFYNAVSVPTAIIVCTIFCSFSGILLGLFVNLQWPESRTAKRLTRGFQLFLSAVMGISALSILIFAAAFALDPYRLFAWYNVIVGLVDALCALIVVPLMFFTLRLVLLSFTARGTELATVRFSLLKLLLTTAFGTPAAVIQLLRTVVELADFGFNALFSHRDPSDPIYQSIVSDIEPRLDIALTTYLYSLCGTMASLPFLLSGSSQKWIRDRWLDRLAAAKTVIASKSMTKVTHTEP